MRILKKKKNYFFYFFYFEHFIKFFFELFNLFEKLNVYINVVYVNKKNNFFIKCRKK